jgi:hypothetical protein
MHHADRQGSNVMTMELQQQSMQGDARIGEVTVINRTREESRNVVFRFGEQSEAPISNSVGNIEEDTLSIENEHCSQKSTDVRLTNKEVREHGTGGSLANIGTLIILQEGHRLGLDLNCPIN